VPLLGCLKSVHYSRPLILPGYARPGCRRSEAPPAFSRRSDGALSRTPWRARRGGKGITTTSAQEKQSFVKQDLYCSRIESVPFLSQNGTLPMREQERSCLTNGCVGRAGGEPCCTRHGPQPVHVGGWPRNPKRDLPCAVAPPRCRARSRSAERPCRPQKPGRPGCGWGVRGAGGACASYTSSSRHAPGSWKKVNNP
jgi:hypothetical protein